MIRTSGDGFLDPVLNALGLLLGDERPDEYVLALWIAALQLSHRGDQLCLHRLIVILQAINDLSYRCLGDRMHSSLGGPACILSGNTPGELCSCTSAVQQVAFHSTCEA